LISLLRTLITTEGRQSPEEELRWIVGSRRCLNLLWVPSHVSIIGNERADAAAKEATQRPTPSRGIMADTDALHVVKKWFGTRARPDMPTNIPRAHQVAISRWRLGYTRATHAHRMEKKDPPKCESCDKEMTTRHLLFECPRYATERYTTGLTDRHLDGSREGTERLHLPTDN
jgi:hypothetical protein